MSFPVWTPDEGTWVIRPSSSHRTCGTVSCQSEFPRTSITRASMTYLKLILPLFFVCLLDGKSSVGILEREYYSTSAVWVWNSKCMAIPKSLCYLNWSIVMRCRNFSYLLLNSSTSWKYSTMNNKRGEVLVVRSGSYLFLFEVRFCVCTISEVYLTWKLHPLLERDKARQISKGWCSQRFVSETRRDQSGRDAIYSAVLPSQDLLLMI